MNEALWLWKQFPRQIASDLSRFHNRRIADWHRGTRDEHGYLVLSSYELLELLEFMPEHGEFKTAARGGEWCDWQLMLATAATEISKLRASYHVVNGGEKAQYDPKVFLTVAERKELAEKDEAQEELRENIFEFADIGIDFT